MLQTYFREMLGWYSFSVIGYLNSCQFTVLYGQWLWLSWKSRHFRFQMSTVQIQLSAKFILNIFCQYWKDKNQEKRPGMAHFFKKILSILNYPRLENFCQCVEILPNLVTLLLSITTWLDKLNVGWLLLSNKAPVWPDLANFYKS